jgi:transposase
MHKLTKNFVGVDVSKNWLDVYILPQEQHIKVDNTPEGIKRLLQLFAKNNIVQIVLESSGGYEHLLMHTCTTAGYKVWQVDPKRIKAFIASEGYKAKTDKIDAQMIAQFASQKESSYAPHKMSPINETMRTLIRRRADLTEMAAMEKKRLKLPFGHVCKEQIERHLSFLDQEIKNLDDQVQKLIKQDEHLSNRNNILQSIPGVGKTTAAALLADMPELGAIDNKKAAALIGVAPYTRQSGMYRGSEAIGGGRHLPRKALYMAALTASRSNKQMKEFYTRLRDKGKKPKVAIVAVMNKLTVTINAMLRKDERWIYA